MSTVILAAAYLLNMFRRVMQGPIRNEMVLSFKDITLREIVCLAPIIILMFWMGLHPQPLLRKMDASVSNYLENFKRNSSVLAKKAPSRPPTAAAVLRPNKPGSRKDEGSHD